MGRWTGRLPALVTFLLTIALIVPWQGNLDRLGRLNGVPVPSGSPDPAASTVALLDAGLWWRVEPDYSLFLVLHESAARGAPWLLISPMGPMGFLFRGWHPGTALALLFWWGVLAAAGWLALWSAGSRVIPSPPWRAGWYCALLLALFANPRDTMLLLLPLLLLPLRFWRDDGRSDLPSYVGAFAAALAALVKSSSLVLSALVVLALIGDDVRRRRLPRVPIAFLISFCFLYVLSGQGVARAPEWLVATAHLLGSFGEYWTLDRIAPVAIVLLFAALAIVPAAIESRSWIHAVALLLAGGAVLKAGLVRYDPYHLLIARSALLALIILYAPRIRSAKAAAAAVVVAFLGIVPVLDGAEIGRQLLAAANPLRAHRESARLFALELASIRAKTSRPPLEGSVDWYDSRQSVIVAHGLDFAPRPVFQSVNVANEYLGRMNAEHLRAHPPAYLFYEPLPLDDRVPAAEDAWSWLDRLRGYEVLGGRDSIVLLQRRREPRRIKVHPIGGVSARFGQPVAVPTGDAIRVRIELEPSLRGRLAGLTFGAPPVHLQVRSGAAMKRYRLMRSTAAAGFLLSPLVESAGHYALLDRQDREWMTRSRVSTISLESSSPAGYEETFRVEFYALELGSSP